MVKRFLIFLFAITAFHGRAQQKQIDSLKQIVSLAKEDSPKVTSLNELARRLLLSDDYRASVKYAEEARELAGKLFLKKEEALALKTEGTANYRQGHYPDALKNYFSSLKLMEELGDKKGVANCYNNIGSVYDSQNNYAETQKNYRAALKIRKELNDTAGLAMSYNNIGIAYINMGELDKALTNLMAALKLFEGLGDKRSLASCYSNLASIYFDRGDAVESLKNDFAALKIREQEGEKEDIAMSWLNIAGSYEKLKKYKEAEDYCKKGLALASEIEYLELIKLADQTLSDIYSNTGQYDKALSFYKKMISMKDSLVNEENTKKTVRLEMNYEFNKREAAAKIEQEKKEAVAETENKRRRVILLLVSCVLFLVACFAVFAYRSYLQKQKSNNAIIKQKELIEEKQKEILDSIHYAKRIQTALLPSEKYIERNLKGK